VGRLDHAAVDEHRSARKRERVDLADVDHLERVIEFRVLHVARNRIDEATTEVFDVRRHGVVPQEGQLLARFRGCLASKLHILGRRVLVFRRRDDGL